MDTFRTMTISAFLILSPLLTGCQTIGSAKRVEAIPLWVRRSPKMAGMYCVKGASEPTFYREDAKHFAGDNARKELARSLNLNIKSIMIDIATEKGSAVDEASIMQVSSWTSSAVLRESKIIEYWYDSDGSASMGKRGITYALACMPLDSVRQASKGLLPIGMDADIIEKLKKIKERQEK